MREDEWELLQRYARTGEQSAFAELAGRHVEFVYGSCLRQLRDAHLAEDVTQGVFLVLATKGKGLPRGTILSGWLFQVARYACGNAVKMRSRRARHESAAARPAIVGGESAGHAMDELRLLLDDAVSRLRQADRQAVLLRYFEDRSVQEVAAALGVSENAATKRLSRAIGKLRALFAQRGVVLPAMAAGDAIAAASRTDTPSAVHAAAALAARHSGAAPAAITVAKATMQTMKWAYIKSAVASVAAAMIIVGCGGVLAHQAMTNRRAPASTPVASVPASTGPATTPATQPDKAMVDNHPAQAQSNAEHGAWRRVRYIQVSTMRQVSEVRRRLKTENFGDVARDMSENAASRELGGELPPFSVTDANYPAVFREVAFALNVGQVSDAVQYKGAFYIIELEEILPPRAAPQTRPGS